MSGEKCKYCGGEIGYIGMPYGFTCLNRNCITHNDKEFIQELKQQLKAAKEENEKLMEQLNTKYLEWEETFMENQNLTQQNKQMRVAINNIKNLCNEDWEDMTVDKFQNQLLQALKGVE